LIVRPLHYVKAQLNFVQTLTLDLDLIPHHPISKYQMIAYVKGPITKKTPTYVIVEAGGIGYRINISLHTHARIETNVTVQLLTYFHVKEDGQTLYGFVEEAERDMFIKLISVSGIGPNTARILLSSITPQEARTAIISEDIRTLNAVKGIGPKTAKRLIVEPTATDNKLREEALSALTTLGFNRIRVQKVLNKVLKENPKVPNAETLIKLALKNMA